MGEETVKKTFNFLSKKNNRVKKNCVKPIPRCLNPMRKSDFPVFGVSGSDPSRWEGIPELLVVQATTNPVSPFPTARPPLSRTPNSNTQLHYQASGHVFACYWWTRSTLPLGSVLRGTAHQMPQNHRIPESGLRNEPPQPPYKFYPHPFFPSFGRSSTAIWRGSPASGLNPARKRWATWGECAWLRDWQ